MAYDVELDDEIMDESTPLANTQPDNAFLQLAALAEQADDDYLTTGNQRQQMSDGSDEEDRPKRQKKGNRKPPAAKIEDTGCSSDNFVEFLEGSEVSDDK